MSRKIHVSWVIAWMSFGILLGVVFSLETGNIFTSWSWLVIGISFSAISLISRRVFIVILAVIAGLSIGLYRGSSVYSAQSGYEKFFGQSVVVSGVVAEDTSFSAEGRQRIKLKHIKINNESLAGQVWVSTPDVNEIKRSDQITAQGLLGEGFGNFPASIFRAEILKINRVLYADPALEVRDKFAESTRKAIDEPEASLGIGYLTGQHSTLPEDLDNDLRLLGLTHVVVASGYNLTILVRFARRTFARYSKYLATFVSLTLVSCFILVTGFSPSMSRAGLIALLSILAWYFGRKIHPLVLLPFSAAITVLINPSFIWGDLGWYLSFAAFGGVMLLAPLLLDYFWGRKKTNQVHQIFLETLSAQIATAPIIAYTFSFYAPLSIVANLLILPLIPATMILTFVAGIGALTFSGLATLFGFPASVILTYMTEVTDRLTSLPFSEGDIETGLPHLVTAYMLLITIAVYMKRRTNHNFKQDSLID